MAITVYITTNMLNNKSYVGMTNGKGKKYLGSGIYISRAIKYYGKNNFVKVDLGEFNSREEAHFWEGFYIKHYKTHISQDGYNLNWTGGYEGQNHSETTKALLKIKCSGWRHTDAAKEKIIKALIDRPCSVETRKKISESNKGVERSLEYKEKQRVSHLGKKASENTKQKMRIAHKNISDETRKLLSEKAKQQWIKQKLIKIL